VAGEVEEAHGPGACEPFGVCAHGVGHLRLREVHAGDDIEAGAPELLAEGARVVDRFLIG